MTHDSDEVWERESFNHMIRTCDHWSNLVDYTRHNPVVAGFCPSPELWPFSSSGAHFEMADEVQFVDPRELPYVRCTTRGELPHLFKDGCTFFVTFRLFDAVILKGGSRSPRRAGGTPAPQ
jgi:hypothetical protein